MLTSGTKKVYIVGIIFDVSATCMGINNLETGNNIRENGSREKISRVVLSALMSVLPLGAADIGTRLSHSNLLVCNTALASITPVHLSEFSQEFIISNTNQRIGKVFQFPSYNQSVIKQISFNKSIVAGILWKGKKFGVQIKIGYKDPMNSQK